MKINATPAHVQMPSPAASSHTGKACAPAEQGAAPVEADDVTQDALSAALNELRADTQPIDSDNVARMQAQIAAGTYAVDTDDLSGAMLGFYRNK